MQLDLSRAYRVRYASWETVKPAGRPAGRTRVYRLASLRVLDGGPSVVSDRTIRPIMADSIDMFETNKPVTRHLMSGACTAIPGPSNSTSGMNSTDVEHCALNRAIIGYDLSSVTAYWYDNGYNVDETKLRVSCHTYVHSELYGVMACLFIILLMNKFVLYMD